MSVSAAFHLRGKDSFVRTREFQTVRLRRLLPDSAKFRARSRGRREVRLSARVQAGRLKMGTLRHYSPHVAGPRVFPPGIHCTSLATVGMLIGD